MSHKTIRKVLSGVLSFAVAAASVSSFTMQCFAENYDLWDQGIMFKRYDGATSVFGLSEAVFIDENGSEIVEDLSSSSDRAGVLPSSYSIYDNGYGTSVKNQGSLGLCWTFAGMSAAETSMLKKGLVTAEPDYSEKHMAWFTNGATPTDMSDPTYGDGTAIGTDAYNTGGNVYDVTATLMRGSGVELETVVPYSTTTALSESLRYDSYGRLLCTREYASDDYSAIKEAIMNYSSLYGSMYVSQFSSDYKKTDEYTSFYQTGSTSTNHAISLVGWDDNFSKDNFSDMYNSGGTPAADGAWLVKNSWGSNWATQDGFFWVSYYDTTLVRLTSFEMTAADENETIYQYDGVIDSGWYWSSASTCVAFANVFTAKNSNPIDTVAFYLRAADVPYTIKVYTDVVTTPDTGTLAYTQSGTAANGGYCSVPLNSAVAVAEGSKFAVEVTFSDGTLRRYVDNNSYAEGTTYVSATSSSNYRSWHVLENSGNACIKAYSSQAASKKPVVTATAGDSKVTLSWDAINGATLYKVYQKSGSGWNILNNTTSTSYTVTGLTNGTEYTFAVRSYSNGAWSDFDASTDSVTATPFAIKPSVTATAGNGNVTLRWNAVNGAALYKVYQKSGTGWKILKDTTTTIYTVSGLTNGTAYTFAVRAYVNGAWSAFTASTDSITATPIAPAKPIVTATAGNASVTLNWNTVSGATLYKVYQKSGSDWKILKDTTATSYTVSGLTNGTTYTFAVRAYVNGAWSTFTVSIDSITATPVAPAKPIVTATAGNASVTLNWNTVSGATLYKVYQKSGSDWKILKDITATTYTATGLTNGTTYTFAVRAYLNGAWSTFTASTDSVSATPTSPNKPIVTATAGTNSVTLSWNAVSGATLYKVYQKTATGWKILKEVTANTYTVTGLTNGTAYTFAVRSYSGSWSTFNAATDSVTATPTVIAKPVVTATAGNGNVTLSWGVVNNASLYKVYQKTATGWKLLKDVTATSYTVTGLANGTAYTFAVRSYSGAWSTFNASTDSVSAIPHA